MKRFLLMLTGAVVWASFLVPPENVSAVPPQETTAGQPALAELTDTTGAVLRLREYSLEVSDEKIRNALYGRKTIVPLVRGEGLLEYFGIEGVREYQFDGSGARVVLTTGETAAGNPCTDCTLEGEGPLGHVSIPFIKVKALRFGAALGAAARRADVENPKRPFRWERTKEGGSRSTDESSEETATVLTSTGESYVLTWIRFNALRSGCDDRYIPCRPWSEWEPSYTLKVKYGDTTNEAELGTLKSLEFSSPVAPPSKAPAVGSRTLAVRVTTATGDTLDATLDENDRPSLMGLTPTGSVLIPLRAIRSIHSIQVGPRP